ncbi:MAG: SRPBCC family protein [Enhydrobacter sp.]
MLKIVGIVIIVILVVAGGILIYAATKPNNFRVERSLAIKAPPEKIYAQIADLKAWQAWSPYEKKDPGMKRTLSGAPNGKGAVYEWDGNKNVGAGRMEVIEATAPSKVGIKLDFLKPFEGHNTAEFTMYASGGPLKGAGPLNGEAAPANTTTVTWAMYGPSPFMMKVMGTFMNMDRMIGDDFAVGLANLKALVEK